MLQKIIRLLAFLRLLAKCYTSTGDRFWAIFTFAGEVLYVCWRFTFAGATPPPPPPKKMSLGGAKYHIIIIAIEINKHPWNPLATITERWNTYLLFFARMIWLASAPLPYNIECDWVKESCVEWWGLCATIKFQSPGFCVCVDLWDLFAALEGKHPAMATMTPTINDTKIQINNNIKYNLAKTFLKMLNIL